MTLLNRSLLMVGVLSVALGLTSISAQATTTFQADSLSPKKDTIAVVPTVRDSLLMERLAKLQKTIPLPYHSVVQSYVDYFVFRKPSYTRTMLERMPLFFPLYEKMLAQYDLPDELKFLSIVESALNPRAVSHAGAGGLWQFMPGTGRDMRLYQDDYVDERMDPVKATEAACKYLRDLYNIFGDWHMALAAYNSGPGTVKRAMRRSGGDSFWTIYNHLPKETRAYVPQFIAITYLMHYANDHGIFGEKFEYPIPNDTIQISGYFNLESFARHSNIPLANLQKLNPAVTTTMLPEYTQRYPLRVPREQFAYFSSRRRAIMDSASRLPVAMPHVLLAHAEAIQYGTDSMTNWASLGGNPLAGMRLGDELDEAKVAKVAAQLTDAEPVNESDEDLETVVLRKPKKQTYTVQRGDNLISIANRHHVEVYDLKRWNHLRSSTLQRGQRLVILKEVSETRAERLADQGTEKARRKAEVTAKTKRYKPRYHRVQNGDTLWNIVQRYDGLTIDRLKKMNNMRSNALRPGQKLIVG
ncbi:lytic transglycosylase domain-containing protein [Spirosoma sp. 209]|uniref:lytic transglycosylase domain-containing protein n=1 Tax=Spirosoma sp. 209 TaxID=1955701 RepID=UPI00098D467F|nr:lytic transglycosylase domain-containing protein [Spirosoma sp. 209]